VPGIGFSPFGQSFGPAYGQGYGQGFGQNFGQGFGQNLGWGGMSHTGGVPGLGVFGVPQQQGWGGYGGVQGLAQNPFFAQLLGMNPYFQGGISHTSPEAQWLLQQQQQQVDPYYGMRVSQTFPFAQMPLSPVG
jgi:hypothetical protein